jgi:hypothetical protein
MIDHVLYAHEAIQLRRLLQPLTARELATSFGPADRGLPDHLVPSDHIPIAAQFVLCQPDASAATSDAAQAVAVSTERTHQLEEQWAALVRDSPAQGKGAPDPQLRALLQAHAKANKQWLAALTLPEKELVAKWGKHKAAPPPKKRHAETAADDSAQRAGSSSTATGIVGAALDALSMGVESVVRQLSGESSAAAAAQPAPAPPTVRRLLSRFECLVCGTRLSAPLRYNDDGDETPTPCECEQCGAQFWVRPESLRRAAERLRGQQQASRRELNG